jgi:hypothetical protein
MKEIDKSQVPLFRLIAEPEKIDKENINFKIT